MDFVGLMCSRICEYLSGFDPSVYIYGSYCCEDYRDGWSDIDILVLTGKPLDRPTAERLLGLRKTLFSQYPDMPQLLTFEGGFTDAAAFVSGGSGLSVYWGTSKERLTEGYSLDCFGTKQLLENGILFCGSDHRDKIKMPDYEALCRGIRRHCDTVRTYVTTTGRSIYSFGWMLDISRCIYTLKTGELIPKTKAAEWALEKGICPVEEALRLSLGVRRNPEAALNSAHTMDLAENMAGYIQAYCDVLEQELKKAEKTVSVTVSDKASEPKHFIVRSRGIIETDRGYPIIVQRNVGFSLLPGGGAEGDETPEECFIREVREETGLEVVPRDRFLILTENYEDTRIVSHFFTCKVIAEHEKKLTENEIIKGSVCEFVSLEEMEAVFSDYERYKDIFTDKYRTYLRESLGIREYKRLKGLGV